jgi:hypothetical protein
VDSEDPERIEVTRARKGGLTRLKYRREFCKLARTLCKFGAPQSALAEHIGVTPETISHWIGRFPEFARAIQSTRDAVDRKVEKTLFQRAMGWKHKGIKVIKTSDDQIIDHPIVEKFPPDVEAARLWLMNRQPERWRRSGNEGTTVQIVQGLDPSVQAEMMKRMRQLDQEEQRATMARRLPAGEATVESATIQEDAK